MTRSYRTVHRVVAVCRIGTCMIIINATFLLWLLDFIIAFASRFFWRILTASFFDLQGCFLFILRANSHKVTLHEKFEALGVLVWRHYRGSTAQVNHHFCILFQLLQKVVKLTIIYYCETYALAASIDQGQQWVIDNILLWQAQNVIIDLHFKSDCIVPFQSDRPSFHLKQKVVIEECDFFGDPIWTNCRRYQSIIFRPFQVKANDVWLILWRDPQIQILGH